MIDLTNTQSSHYKVNFLDMKLNFTYRIHHSSQGFYNILLSDVILSLFVIISNKIMLVNWHFEAPIKNIISKWNQ